MKANGTLALLCILICIPLASCSRVVAHANTSPPEGVPVDVTRVILQDVPLEIAAVGNVEAVERVDVKPRIAGRLEPLPSPKDKTSPKASFSSPSIATP